MSTDPRDVTLERIRQIADNLLLKGWLTPFVRKGVEEIKALTQHCDNPAAVEHFEGEEEYTEAQGT